MPFRNILQGAQLFVQQAEYDAAFADPPTLPGADASLYSNLKDAQTLFIVGDHDVFGTVGSELSQLLATRQATRFYL